MIDEKKLIEERPEWLNTDCVGSEKYNKGWNDCNKYWCNTIKRQPKVGDWIPCSERLPENISTVIVQVKEIEKPTFGWYGSISGWRLIEIDFVELKGFTVIAWQPLPEPYKEE